MRWTALLIPCALAGAAPAAGRTGREEVVPAERRVLPYDANIPGCQDPGVLAKVTQIFAEKEAKFWNSSLTIVQYENIRRLPGLRPLPLQGLGDKSGITHTALPMTSAGRRL